MVVLLFRLLLVVVAVVVVVVVVVVCSMALGSTQPLTEISTRGISWRVQAAGALD